MRFTCDQRIEHHLQIETQRVLSRQKELRTRAQLCQTCCNFEKSRRISKLALIDCNLLNASRDTRRTQEAQGKKKQIVIETRAFKKNSCFHSKVFLAMIENSTVKLLCINMHANEDYALKHMRKEIDSQKFVQSLRRKIV